MNEQNGWYRPRHPRIDRVTLTTPDLRGKRRPGELVVQWHVLTATIRWDCNLGACPEFEKCLQAENWDRELIARLNSSGYEWDFSPRIYLPHQRIRKVDHNSANFVLDTLSGVYERATACFAEQHAKTFGHPNVVAILPVKPEPARQAPPAVIRPVEKKRTVKQREVSNQETSNTSRHSDNLPPEKTPSIEAQPKVEKARQCFEAGSD